MSLTAIQVGGRRLGHAGWLRQVRRPTRAVDPIVPNAVGERIEVLSRGGAIIQHGAQQSHSRRLDAAAIENPLREARGQPTAGALTANGDATPVDAQALGVLEEPEPRLVAVVD